ncbi:MAG TPA: hypothetical protein VFA59_04015, partial [Vicinamibacterales bacterium]|nr:hypothetical protein [Vicinamibacterales bacterium]
MRKALIFAAMLFCCSNSVFAQAATADTDTRIPPGSRLYIAPIEGGYDTYLAAAIHSKQVPLILVTDRAKADFELSGVTESERASWAKIAFLGSTSTNEQASIKIINIKSGTIVFGY